MNNETKTKEQRGSLDRITLNSDTLQRVDRWLNQLTDHCKGIRASRTDIVRWLISSHSPELSLSELRAAKEAMFDDLEYALWLAKEIREARGRGEKVSILDLVHFAKERPGRMPSKPRHTSHPTEPLTPKNLPIRSLIHD